MQTAREENMAAKRAEHEETIAAEEASEDKRLKETLRKQKAAFLTSPMGRAGQWLAGNAQIATKANELNTNISESAMEQVGADYWVATCNAYAAKINAARKGLSGVLKAGHATEEVKQNFDGAATLVRDFAKLETSVGAAIKQAAP